MPFRQRIIPAFLGLFLFFAFLEIGFRLGGFILLSIQDHRNAQSIKQKGAYRILCLGESTTQAQYPQFLEEALNQRNLGVKFSVIDKGSSGTDTPAILSQVESYLDEYRPDAVVAMMGCNDEGVRYYQNIPEANTWLFRHCRVYRFCRIIYMHILNKKNKVGLYGLNRLDPDEKARELNPQNDSAYDGLGWFYLDQGKYLQAEDVLKKAIEFNPQNDNAYVGLGRFYRYQGKYLQAEDVLKKAIKFNPQNDNAYVELGRFYRYQGKYLPAQEALKKAVEFNPQNDNAYVELGWLYLDQNKSLGVENAFKKATELNPQNDNAYLGLGGAYLDQGKFSQAEYALKKAIELNSINDRAYGALLLLYAKIGRSDLAKSYAKKANRLRLEYYSPVTVGNYRKLKEILDKRKIKLICVQYPMRNLEPLKVIFEQDQGVIFVDNESIFKEALKKSSYKEYFKDMFAGDFGHCTDKGNRLLAQNIADSIFKEVFGK
jgi:tetratricopeptide (TPR) repeat protein